MKEIKLRYEYIGSEIIHTIYLGGGTPSLLTGTELNQVISAVRTQYAVDPTAEITLEANPDDITIPRLKEWKQAGINRLSIGIQSFFDEDLQWMNRAHSAGQAKSAILNAQFEGFNNITIDLIFGTPGLTDERWLENLNTATSLGISHLSCYALTVEPSTALHKMIAQKKVLNVIPEDQARQFLLLMDHLQRAGYEHYEISNFALPGFRSRHNSSYWQGKKYLGLGPSAHSFNGHSRQWNIANNALYIKGLENGLLNTEIENLTSTQQLNEYVMISLRTMEGIDLLRLKTSFGTTQSERLLNESSKYIQSGKMEVSGNFLRLTREGKLFADGIAGELFSI